MRILFHRKRCILASAANATSTLMKKKIPRQLFASSLSTVTSVSSTIINEEEKEREDPPPFVETIETSMLDFDRKHIWHPYTSLTKPLHVYPVSHTNENYIHLTCGSKLIDGMSSWWCAIHGYNNKELRDAMISQIHKMPHIMFGGLTHKPAIQVCQKLVDILPYTPKVFLCDSGSVSVEVAIKMALQYQLSSTSNNNKKKIMTCRKGYHGDTFGAMSVCDPETGMHHIFSSMLSKQIFLKEPKTPYPNTSSSSKKTDQNIHKLYDEDLEELHTKFEQHHHETAAFIIEPIVQGAGGMRIYSPLYLEEVYKLCKKYNILLILDEIATGFGRTGKLFGHHHCSNGFVKPDIICLGKSLTGGQMTMAATLCTEEVGNTICTATPASSNPGVFMHGPTFMANPLACSVASKSLDLLRKNNNYEEKVMQIQSILTRLLLHNPNLLKKKKYVSDVRVLGAIGVVECTVPVNVQRIQEFFVKEKNVWIRPFGKNIYIMPPFITPEKDIKVLCQSIEEALDQDEFFLQD